MPAFQELLSTLAGTRGLFYKFVVGQGLRTEAELFQGIRSEFDFSLGAEEARRVASTLARGIEAGRLMSAGETISPLDVPIHGGLLSPGGQRAPFMASVIVTAEVQLQDGSRTTISRPVVISRDSLIGADDIAAAAIGIMVEDRDLAYNESVDEDTATVEIQWAFRTFQ